MSGCRDGVPIAISGKAEISAPNDQATYNSVHGERPVDVGARLSSSVQNLSSGAKGSTALAAPAAILSTRILTRAARTLRILMAR